MLKVIHPNPTPYAHTLIEMSRFKIVCDGIDRIMHFKSMLLVAIVSMFRAL